MATDRFRGTVRERRRVRRAVYLGMARDFSGRQLLPPRTRAGGHDRPSAFSSINENSFYFWIPAFAGMTRP